MKYEPRPFWRCGDRFACLCLSAQFGCVWLCAQFCCVSLCFYASVFLSFPVVSLGVDNAVGGIPLSPADHHLRFGLADFG